MSINDYARKGVNNLDKNILDEINEDVVELTNEETAKPCEKTLEPTEEVKTGETRKRRRRKRRKVKKPLTPAKVFLRVLKWVGISLLSLILVIVIGFLTIFYSPWFIEVRDRYILMTYKTSNSWLSTVFFSQELIDKVFEENGMVDTGNEVDPDLIGGNSSEIEGETEPTPKPIEFSTSKKYPATEIYNDGDVQIIEFSGTQSAGSYTARLIQIKDPSRVFLGVTSKLGTKGELIADQCAKNDALCGINAGGWVDVGGVGSGGTPLGTIIKDGKITNYTINYENQVYSWIIGFTNDNVLVIGEYTNDEIKELGIRDGMSWRAPVKLIVNGEKVEYKGLAGGYDPRSAIGQREDGVVLLLAIDGTWQRGIDGADFAMVADIMYEFGAVNAANLDGGTSSVMSLKGQTISNNQANPAVAHRGRYLPTTWLVKNKAAEDGTSSTEASSK